MAIGLDAASLLLRLPALPLGHLAVALLLTTAAAHLLLAATRLLMAAPFFVLTAAAVLVLVTTALFLLAAAILLPVAILGEGCRRGRNADQSEQQGAAIRMAFHDMTRCRCSDHNARSATRWCSGSGEIGAGPLSEWRLTGG